MSALHSNYLSDVDSSRTSQAEFPKLQTLRTITQNNISSEQAQNKSDKENVALLPWRQSSETTSSSVEVIPEDSYTQILDKLLKQDKHETIGKEPELYQIIPSEESNLFTARKHTVKMEETPLADFHGNSWQLRETIMELLTALETPIIPIVVMTIDRTSAGKSSLLNSLNCLESTSKIQGLIDATMIIYKHNASSMVEAMVELCLDVGRLFTFDSQFKTAMGLSDMFIIFTPLDGEHLRELARILKEMLIESDDDDAQNDNGHGHKTIKKNIIVILEDTSEIKFEIGHDPADFLEKELVKYDLSKAMCCKMRVYHFPTLLSHRTSGTNMVEQSIDKGWKQIINLSEPFAVGDFIINGRRYAQLITSYIDVLNNDNKASMTEFIVLLRSELQKLSQQMIESYKSSLTKELKASMPVDNDTLQRTNENISTRVLGQFQAMSMISEAKLQDEVQKLKTTFDKTFSRLCKENESISREKCTLLLQHCFENVKSKSKAGYYNDQGPDEYTKDIDAATEQYNRTENKGPLADAVLEEYHQCLTKKERSFENDSYVPTSIEEQVPSYIEDDNHILTKIEEAANAVSKHSEKEGGKSKRVLHLIDSGKYLWEIEQSLLRKTAEVKTLQHMHEERKAEIRCLQDKINKLQTLLMTQDQVKGQPTPEETKDTELSPSSSISDQEKEWIRVVESKQMSANEEPNYTCQETTEKEISLQKKLKKTRDHVKELAKANTDWESYSKSQTEHHQQQLTALMQELNDAKKKLKHLEIKCEQKTSELETLRRSTEAKCLEAEEQKTKAISFAAAQADKVDELKKSLRKEQVKAKELEDKVIHLQNLVTLKTVEVEEVTKNLNELKVTQARVTSPHQPVTDSGNENVIHLTTENQAPLSQESSFHSGSPFQPSPVPGNNNHDRSMIIRDCRTDIEVLQQQVTIYKEDFDTERRDRERAQAEIATLKNALDVKSDDCRCFQEELRTKSREIEALRVAREEDRYLLEQRQDEAQRLKTENRELKTQIELLKRQEQAPPPPYEYVPSQTSYHGTDSHQHVGGNVNHVHSQTARIQNVDSPFLPREWVTQIRSNFGRFRNHLKPFDVIMQLYTRNIISYREKEQLDVMCTDYERAEYIISNIILRGTKETLAIFGQILLDSHQTELARLLPKERDSSVPVRKWKCHCCTYENTGNHSRCQMCFTPNTQVDPFSHDDMMGRGIDQCDNGIEWVRPAQYKYNTHDLETDADEENTTEKKKEIAETD